MLLDPEAARFFAQLSISLITLFFCFSLISIGYVSDNPDLPDPGSLWALVCFITGFWFEAPRLRKKKS